MKHIILLLCAAATLASCQSKQCWQCTIVQTFPEGIIYRTTQTEMVCNKTRRQIRAYEQSKTFVVLDPVTKDTAWWQVTTCK